MSTAAEKAVVIARWEELTPIKLICRGFHPPSVPEASERSVCPSRIPFSPIN